ncbi:RING finger protein 151 [Antennarius striatus]|uniref:RING finger protein 151 n=1 Tax=Antennarius striatus TaxID=241820 RepID=UPI0035AFA5CD
MGYDLERFVGYVNEGLLCCVCRDVLERPLQAPCEHAYCSSCISSWLLNHQTCPEDRLPLDEGSLKPLFRYMRNDLNRLQIRCVNAGRGCETICSLESLHAHEDGCEFAITPCFNTGCPVQVERRRLEAHLSECNFRSRECPNGCGHILLSADQGQHNCVAELRAELEALRAEMLNKVKEVRREMESRLETQRRHMVQEESQLKDKLEDLKVELSFVVCDMTTLSAKELLRKQELEEAEVVKKELLVLLKDLQPFVRHHSLKQLAKDQHQRDHKIDEWVRQIEGANRHQRGVSFFTPRPQLLSAEAMNASGQSPPLRLGEGIHKRETRSLTPDGVKKNSQEVTMI